MKKILVATDFSKAASNAAIYAVKLATGLKASLLLLHVYQIPTTYSELPITVNADEMADSAKEEMLKLKRELLQKTKENITIDTQIMEGIFYQALTHVCEETSPYLVIIGTQGATSAERLLFGSDAVYTMKHLEWPIIAVPMDYSFEPIRQIGFACDLHQVEDIPIEKMKGFLHEFNAEFHVLNTSKRETHTLDLENRPTVLFEKLTALKPEYHFIQDDDVDEGTLNFAHKNGFDLLIILPKKHNLIVDLLFKGHTGEFVLHSPIPIMALHE
ncbi:MAG: universal stress protein [Saprospiraceae bacterium]